MSNKDYKRNDIQKPQHVIHPAIDPLSSKNIMLSDEKIKNTLEKFDISLDKPIIGQISRFDKWKDPVGVIRIFEKVKKKIDCRLVLCGSMATDDPEGREIYEKVRKVAEPHIKKGDLKLITVEDDTLVNALQRAFDVTIQKSWREGFGLTVTESLWKGTPVVASNRGGIRLQIDDGVNGFLLEPDDDDSFVKKIIFLLENKNERKKMGINGERKVKEKFLITRLLEDYIDLLTTVLKN
ncbi:MAG: glycosyltransferase [Candidatus Micrarchaeota archaeon]|nr:glycosyltransferase [Candidatus Micrarchaeota archaeon]